MQGLCHGLRECHDTHDVKIVCEACATSHPYLVSFPFYTIPIYLLFKIRRIFIYLSPLIFIYIQCESLSGVSPIKIPINRYGVPEVCAHHGSTEILNKMPRRCFIAAHG